MAQATTTSGYATNVAAAFRTVGFGVLIAWQRVYAANVSFFTIGTSTIAGNDIIKAAGSFVTFFDKYQFTDYSNYVMSWAVTRQIGQYPFGVILAQADLELDNTSKLFTPGYDATIGSGILPNRPIKISATVQGENLQQFTGFTGQPDISITQRRMTLHAFDVLDSTIRQAFTTSGTTTSGVATTTSGYLANVTTDQAIAYYLGQLGFSTSQYVLDQGLQQPIGYMSVIDRKFGDVLAQLVQAEQGLMFADENGMPRFWNRQHFSTTSGIGFKFNLNYNNMISLDYESTAIINDVIVNAQPRAVGGNQPIWELKTVQEISPGQKVDIFADFIDNYGDLPVTNVSTPTNSGATSSFSVSSAIDGSGADPGTLSLIGVFLFGKTYKMTFQNTGTNSAFITRLILYGTPARVKEPISQRYFDPVSIEAYGRNPSNNGDPIIIDNDYIQDKSTAYSLAYTLVREYSTPRRRYRATVFADPSLQIGDYGTVTILDTGEVKTMWIVGTQLAMGRNGDLQQILWLEERQIQSYFTVGSSLIAATDSIAP